MEESIESHSQRVASSCVNLSAPLIEAMVGYLHAMASPVRMRIVLELAEHDLAVRDLVRELALPEPVVSRHLAILRQAGIALHPARSLNRLADETAIRVYELAGAMKTLAEPEWHL